MSDHQFQPYGTVPPIGEGALPAPLPAGRMEPAEVRRLYHELQDDVSVQRLLDAIPDMVMILNEQRQIVAINRTLGEFLGTGAETLIGCRPGEAAGCIHAGEGRDGCGTGDHCTVCGAVRTIVASMESGERREGECRLTIDRDGISALDLQVVATPLDAVGERFTLLVLRDVSAQKRRQILERLFFHDILNTVGGLCGIADILNVDGDLSPEIERRLKGLLLDLTGSLSEEITQQRRLLEVEQGGYRPSRDRIELVTFLESVCRLYGHHPRVSDRNVRNTRTEPLEMVTDEALLRRVVGNMILNAMEASPPGSVVTVGADDLPGRVRIRVVNPGEIPQETRLKIFQRSFSTKGGAGRGIGTYSMKLFGEKYLGGSVTFDCRDGFTEFSITLPVVPVVPPERE